VRKGRTPEALAEQFEPFAQTIRNWLAQADRDAGQRPDGLTTDEREILRKAAAWFAKETGSIRSKDSSS
jgi:transposase